MPLPSRIVCALALAASCLATGVRGQQPPPFKAQVEVTPLDVVVLDEEGKPVPELSPDDFTVTIDGRPRKVVTSRFLSSAAAAPAATDGRKGWDLDTAFDSVYVGNDRDPGVEASPARTVVIAIDQSGFGTAAGRTAATAARGLLDLLHPNDRVGLAVFPPPGPFVRPTRDHERVRQALGQVVGAAESRPAGEIQMNVADALTWNSGGDSLSRGVILQKYCSVTAAETCAPTLDQAASEMTAYALRQSLTTLRGLEDVIRATAAEGTASAVVVVSSGLYAGGRATLLGVEDDLQAVARVAASSRAMLYALYVESGFLDRDSMESSRMAGFSNEDGDIRLGGLRQLAGMAGGTVTRVSGGSDEGFRRVSMELSAYYLLGLESQAADRDGRRHRVRVTVNKPGVTVRSRENLYLPSARKLTGEEALREALGEPELARDLPIRMSTQVMREPGTDKVRLLISASIGRGTTAAASDLRVAYLIRGAGKTATEGSSEVQKRTLPVVGTGPEAALSYLETAQLTPGRYLLRLAAIDSKDTLGSVEQVVDATLTNGEGASFSDLLLTDPLRRAKDAFTPVADGRVTGEALEAFLEIYPADRQQVANVIFEVADAPGSPPIVQGSVAPEKRDGGRLVAGVNLELRTLPPGVYILNARALDGERVMGRVSRPFMLERLAGSGAAGPRAALAFSATGGLVKAFSRDELLRPDALGYFLNRLTASETAATGEEVSAAAAAVRGARFDEALATLPGQSDHLSVAFLKGLALLGQGQLEPAAAQFRAALRISSDFLPAAFYLGACYAAGGRDREAVGAWQTSLVSETDSRIVYEVLADALLRLNDGRQAEAIITEARERWPGDEVFMPRLAAAKVLLNQRAEALAVLEPYLERHPTESEPLFLAIRLLYEAHDAGKPLKGAAEDRGLAKRLGELYRASGGANQPLVARWVAAMTK